MSAMGMYMRSEVDNRMSELHKQLAQRRQKEGSAPGASGGSKRPPAMPKAPPRRAHHAHSAGPSSAHSLLHVHGMQRGPKESSCTPLDWTGSFDSHELIAGTHGRTYSVYRTTFDEQSDAEDSVPVLLLHGAGATALSWAACAKSLREQCSELYSVDLRGHGLTSTSEDARMDLETLADDICDLLNVLKLQECAIIGHSLGGAVAVRVVHRMSAREMPASLSPVRIVCLAVLDIVEGTSVGSLHNLKRFLENRPAKFPSPTQAIFWTLSSGLLRNPDSARMSVPSQLREEDNDLFVWRTDLLKSMEHWQTWLEGLTSSFLACPVPKMLLVAGQDRLDKDMMVAQMQGRFQHTVVRDAGHFVHEDRPKECAEAICRFLDRQLHAVRALRRLQK